MSADIYAPAQSWGVNTVKRYKATEQIGEGTYGKVFKGVDVVTGERVALKRMNRHHESEGFPRTETREIKILNSLRHPNLVLLKELVTDITVDGVRSGDMAIAQALSEAAAAVNDEEGGEGQEGSAPSGPTPSSTLGRLGDVYLVFEYVDYDLAGLLDSQYKFDARQVRVIMFQLLQALAFLHARGIIHRDLKCSNLLLKDDHTLKLGDFGLARTMPAESIVGGGVGGGVGSQGMTNRVITLWYRPPELLLGAINYTPTVDMWSAGCILLELLIGRPVFPAKTEAEQLTQLMKILGTPPEDSALRGMPLWSQYVAANGVPNKPSRLTELFSRCDAVANDPDCLALLTRMLEGDPRKRITARDALASRYFKDVPRERPTSMLKNPARVSDASCFKHGVDHHEFSSKVRRRAELEAQEAKLMGTTAIAGAIPPRADSFPPPGGMPVDPGMAAGRAMPVGPIGPGGMPIAYAGPQQGQVPLPPHAYTHAQQAHAAANAAPAYALLAPPADDISLKLAKVYEAIHGCAQHAEGVLHASASSNAGERPAAADISAAYSGCIDTLRESEVVRQRLCEGRDPLYVAGMSRRWDSEIGRALEGLQYCCGRLEALINAGGAADQHSGRGLIAPGVNAAPTRPQAPPESRGRSRSRSPHRRHSFPTGPQRGYGGHNQAHPGLGAPAAPSWGSGGSGSHAGGNASRDRPWAGHGGRGEGGDLHRGREDGRRQGERQDRRY